MKPINKPNPKPAPRQKRELTRRVHALLGKYKGKELMNPFWLRKRAKRIVSPTQQSG